MPAERLRRVLWVIYKFQPYLSAICNGERLSAGSVIGDNACLAICDLMTRVMHKSSPHASCFFKKGRLQSWGQETKLQFYQQLHIHTHTRTHSLSALIHMFTSGPAGTELTRLLFFSLNYSKLLASTFPFLYIFTPVHKHTVHVTLTILWSKHNTVCYPKNILYSYKRLCIFRLAGLVITFIIDESTEYLMI